MNDLWDLLTQAQPDKRTIFLIAFGASVATLLLYFALQYVWSAFRPLSSSLDEEEQSLFVPEKAKTGPLERVDGAFENLVQHTGLEIGADQASAWILFAAVCLAAAAFIARPEWWMALLGFVVGGGIIFSVYLVYRWRYRWKIQDQLPDVFYMLARSTRAGLSVEQAIHMVGEQGKIAVAEVFRRCSAQIELGLAVPVALERAARRLQLIDFNALVSLVGLYRKTGGNLPLLLERLAASTRDHNQFRGHLRSVTALGRISSGCIALATPLILVTYAIYQPEYTEAFFQSRPGWTTVGIALGLELVGVVWLHRILKVEA